MKNAKTHFADRQQIQNLTLLSMFVAVLCLLGFTPIGLIDLPLIKATILHVPVIIGSILLGSKKGAFLGGVFGLISLIKNTITPSLLSFAFSPFIPVPGTEKGSLWALVICFVPRILVGIVPSKIYELFSKNNRHNNTALKGGKMVVSAVAGSLVNTVLVMGLIFILFKDAYATLKGIPVDAVLGVIQGIIVANGLPEALVAGVIAPAVCIPLQKMVKPLALKSEEA